MQNFETFAHQADIGVRGYGKTIEGAFENAAKAMFSVMVRLESVAPAKKLAVFCEAGDLETLLVEWLNKLLLEADLGGMAFCKFKVKIHDNAKIEGNAYGEPLDPKKHTILTEVKAATYSQLKVGQENGRWVAQCVVDV